MKSKSLWYSDTHFNLTLPWTKHSFVDKIKDEKPDSLILTGDISCGITIVNVLSFLAERLDYLPIYFVLGNHDYYGASIGQIETEVASITAKYSNLLWLKEKDIVTVKDGVAFIGDDGWYDARLGNARFLTYNLDWIMISDFRKLKSFDEKKEFGTNLADSSTARLKEKLIKALETHHTVYILTHMPPWAETCRGAGTDIEQFWLPYNINSCLGKMIEAVMQEHPNQNVNVLAGHIHIPSILHVSHNIECIVQAGKYLGVPNEHNTLYI